MPPKSFSEMEDMEADLYIRDRRKARIVTLSPSDTSEQYDEEEPEQEKPIGFLEMLKLKGAKGTKPDSIRSVV